MVQRRTFWREPVTIHLWVELIFLVAGVVFSVLSLVLVAQRLHLAQVAYADPAALAHDYGAWHYPYTFGSSDFRQASHPARRQEPGNGYDNVQGGSSYGYGSGSGYDSASGTYTYGSGSSSTSASQPQLTPEQIAALKSSLGRLVSYDQVSVVLDVFLVVFFALRLLLTPLYMYLGARHARKVAVMDEGGQDMTPLDAAKRTKWIRLMFLVQMVVYSLGIIGIGVGTILHGATDGILAIVWIIVVISTFILAGLAGASYHQAKRAQAEFQPVGQNEDALPSSDAVDRPTDMAVRGPQSHLASLHSHAHSQHSSHQADGHAAGVQDQISSFYQRSSEHEAQPASYTQSPQHLEPARSGQAF